MKSILLNTLYFQKQYAKPSDIYKWSKTGPTVGHTVAYENPKSVIIPNCKVTNISTLISLILDLGQYRVNQQVESDFLFIFCFSINASSYETVG